MFVHSFVSWLSGDYKQEMSVLQHAAIANGQLKTFLG